MKLNIAYYSACGIREKNEDAVSVLETAAGTLAVVADGLGGHGKGEVASATAINVLNAAMTAGDCSAAAMTQAIFQANREICALQTSGTRMKTTVAALLLCGDTATALHVGDSRVYQFRDNEILFQTMDHSVAQLAVLVGEITQDQLRTHPDQNKLVRSLGNPKDPKVDMELLDIAPGDRFLLCSDGFWEPVTEQMMLSALAQSATAQQWLALLRPQAQRHSKDNHTAIAITVDAI